MVSYNLPDFGFTNPTLFFTKYDADFLDTAGTRDGFRMGFHAKVLPVDLDPDVIGPLLRKARRIYDQAKTPDGARACGDCVNFDALVDAVPNWK